MNYVGSSGVFSINESRVTIHRFSGVRPFEVNVETPDKPVDSFAPERSQTAVPAGEPQEASQKNRDEKHDLWMENVKKFIRNIDVKSL